MRLTKMQVAEGMRVPWGYGWAWRDFDTACTVAYPIPFNMLFRGLRRLYHWVLSYKNSVIDEARIAGRREASRSWDWCEVQIQAEITRRMKILEAEFDQRVIEKAGWALKQMRTEGEEI